jgi:hypothetical protein
MKTLIRVAHTGTTAHTIEIDHAFPMSDAWLTLNTPAPEGKMWDDGELVDASCQCDGSDDSMYRCSYPPCVAESEQDAAHYGAMFAAASRGATAAQEFADRVYDEKPYKYGGVL